MRPVNMTPLRAVLLVRAVQVFLYRHPGTVAAGPSATRILPEDSIETPGRLHRSPGRAQNPELKPLTQGLELGDSRSKYPIAPSYAQFTGSQASEINGRVRAYL